MISQNKQTPEKLIVIVGGPAGTGKSTVAASLLSQMTTTPTFKRADGTLTCISVQFVEGDELHPAGNVAKMSAGIPLTDEDRMPWLKLLAETVVTIEPESPTLFTPTTETPKFPVHTTSSASTSIIETEKSVELQTVICTCSCLKRKYRDYLRMSIIDDGGAPNVRLAFVFLYASPEVLIERTMKRNGHFMKSEMVKSQIDALEMPAHEELFGNGGGPGDVVLVGETLQALGPTKLAEWLINKSQVFQ